MRTVLDLLSAGENTEAAVRARVEDLCRSTEPGEVKNVTVRADELPVWEAVMREHNFVVMSLAPAVWRDGEQQWKTRVELPGNRVFYLLPAEDLVEH